MGGAPATIELGATLTGETAGSLLHTRFSTPLHRLGLPIGIRASDVFFATLSRISSRPIPERHQAARGRLVDALVDGHKYLVGKRAVIYGEEDLVVGMTSFLAELGIHPVLCASGGKSGRLKNAVMEALARIDVEPPVVLDDADFHDIEAGARAAGADLLVGHSKGYSFARRVGIPLIRVGFPIHDRVGGQRMLHLGYDGAQALFDLIANSLIEKKQNDSPVGYSYM
jgi:nitrogenase molybdenum-iron protein NifN